MLTKEISNAVGKCFLVNHKNVNRKSPGSDKRFIHLFTLNYMKSFPGLSLFYLYFIPKLGVSFCGLSGFYALFCL